jgi:hypothetical protein
MPVLISLGLALAACGEERSPTPSPSASAPNPLSAIQCATDDPTGVGELTGAWAGSAGGVYYIRQVGDCVWWFGTELKDIVPGGTGQPGFANAAVGRLEGAHLELEYVDLPLGDILGGGGLSWTYVDGNQLLLTEQRGDWQPFGDTALTRIQGQPSPEPAATSPASP